jgi:mRNA-degrading endonuclease toxin of MazEF toxin-antitoxin module
MPEPAPLRGEVWTVNLGAPIGHEAAFTRPALVISADRFNAHGLVVLCPIGRTHRPYPTRVKVDVGVAGLSEVSYIQAELPASAPGLLQNMTVLISAGRHRRHPKKSWRARRRSPTRHGRGTTDSNDDHRTVE